MYTRRSKQSSSAASPGGISYFNHFPSNFLKPYGLANTRPDHTTLMKRIKPKSCEWLKRPKVAMSEFAATMVENMNFLAESTHPFLRHSKISNLKTEMEPFLNSLNELNTKSECPNPTPAHIRTVLQTLYEPSSTIQNTMEDMFEIGGSMFIMGIQYMMARELLSNPEEYSDQLVATDPDSTTFKRERNIRGLTHYLNVTCTNDPGTSQNTKQIRRNLMNELRSSYNEPEQPTVTPQTTNADESDTSDDETSDSDTPDTSKQTQVTTLQPSTSTATITTQTDTSTKKGTKERETEQVTETETSAKNKKRKRHVHKTVQPAVTYLQVEEHATEQSEPKKKKEKKVSKEDTQQQAHVEKEVVEIEAEAITKKKSKKSKKSKKTKKINDPE